jgi:glycosyltransferase involved in cell wall biosynthesis
MPQYGTETGTGQALNRWTESLARAGMKQRVLASASGDRKAQVAGVDVRLTAAPIAVRGLYTQIRDAVTECAVIHFHGAFSPSLSFVVAMALFVRWRRSRGAAVDGGLKLFLTPHGALSKHVFSTERLKKFLYWQFVDRWLFARLDGVICNSPRETREVEERLPGTRVWTVPLVVDKPVGLWCDSVLLKEQQKSDDILLCTVGRYDIHTKGLDLLIEAVLQLNRQGHAVRLRCIGYDRDGAAKSLSNFVQQMGAADHVDCLGPMYGQEKEAVVAQCDVYCVPSRYESFGMSIIEGLYSGIPVLIGEGACVSGFMSDEAAILNVPPDPNAWAKAILKTFEEPMRNMEVAQRERESLSKRLSSTNVGVLLKNCYVEASSLGEMSPPVVD